MCKIKVLQVCYSLKAAGIETLVTNVQKNIDVNRFDVHFLLYKGTKKDLFYKNTVEEHGGTIEDASADKVNNFLIRHLIQRVNYFKILKKENFDVVHIHASSGLQGIEVLLAHMAGVKNIIVHSHNSKLGAATKFNWMKKIIHKKGIKTIKKHANKKLSCSDEATRWMFPNVDKNKVTLIYNGIECRNYSFNIIKRNEIKKVLNIDNNIVYGHIGSFTEAKNHEFIIDIFSKIVEKQSNAVLLLIGDGPLQPTIKEKVKRMKLNNVQFLGIRSDCNELLMTMDCMLFPSFWEGLPIVVVEAQASGLPCLLSDTVTKQVNVSDLLTYLSLNLSAENWCDIAISTVHKRKREDYSDEVSRSSFDILNTANELETIYSKLVYEK